MIYSLIVHGGSYFRFQERWEGWNIYHQNLIFCRHYRGRTRLSETVDSETADIHAFFSDPLKSMALMEDDNERTSYELLSIDRDETAAAQMFDEAKSTYFDTLDPTVSLPTPLNNHLSTFT